MKRSNRTIFGLGFAGLGFLIILAGYHRAHLADEATIAATLADKQKISELYAALAAKDNAITPLLASSNYGLAILDKDAKVREWNPAMEKLSGYSQAEMLGQGLEKVMADDKEEAHKAAFAERLNKSKEELASKTIEVQCEIIHRNPARKPIPVRVAVRVVFPSNDDNDRYVIALIDRVNKIVEITSE